MKISRVFSLPAKHVVQHLDEQGNVSGYSFAQTQFQAKAEATKHAGELVEVVDWRGILPGARPLGGANGKDHEKEKRAQRRN